MRRKIPRTRHALAQVIPIMIVASRTLWLSRVALPATRIIDVILAFPRSFYFAVNFTARPADSRDPTRNRTRYNPPAAISAISKQFHFVRDLRKNTQDNGIAGCTDGCRCAQGNSEINKKKDLRL